MARQSGNGLTEATYLILLSTVNPTHSYGIITKIRALTDDTIKIGPGTLYGALGKMVNNQWMSQQENDGQKIYRITDLGRSVLSDEVARLEKLVKLGRNNYGL